MKKEEFLRKLEERLQDLNEEDRLDALEYYSEFIDEAGEENEEETVRNLGSLNKIAAKIRAELAVNMIESQEIPGQAKAETKDNINAIWYIVLGMLALPFALPAGMVVLAIVFAVMVSIIAVVLSLVVGVFSIGAVGITLIGAGIFTFPLGLAERLSFVGAGLLILGLAILITKGLYFIFSAIVRLIAKIVKEIFKRIRGNKREGVVNNERKTKEN